MYEIEHDEKDTKFTKLSDALWWSIVTLTTIGYGDVYPVTTAGRTCATVTIIFGVGIFGTFISLMGSGLVQVYRENKGNTDALQQPVAKDIECVQKD